MNSGDRPKAMESKKETRQLLPKDHIRKDATSRATSSGSHPTKRRKVIALEATYGKKDCDSERRDSFRKQGNNAEPEASESLLSTSRWQATIASIVNAIVSIRYSQVAAFDTEPATTAEASGFIVDAKQGIILTNRHVACAGPFVGEAVCHDHEEIDLYPIYRDPIHDFGFLKFDPGKIKYMKVTEIKLRPELAKVGLDIRVVGNDAGEKLSILAGSLSRLDRNAPDYGNLTYNDFNTFYLQAASSTSGGSSGSPVIDINGNAVALQAGGSTNAATDFFLPLDRIKYALDYVRRGEIVPRGDIQTQFVYRPFDEVRRLGLQARTEMKLRKKFPDEVGMLVVETVLPEGPAHGKLEEGDVLLTINGEYVTKFGPLETVMDANVGKKIQIGIERGGRHRDVVIKVGDLHSITPDRYVEIGGAKLNELSYQLARAYCVPCRGVYVAYPAGMFMLDGPDGGWIIKSVDDQPTPTLDAFIQVMKTLPDRKRVPVVYYSITDTHTSLMQVIDVERHWSDFRLAVRNDKTGLWDFTDLGEPIPPLHIQPVTKQYIQLDESFGPAKDLIHCLVKVSFYMPYYLDGFPTNYREGAGVIMDKDRGLVVVSRNIVPTTMGDLTLTVSDYIVIPGKVIFLHPTHNFAIVQYDPSLLGDTSVMATPISDEKLVQGHRVKLVAYNYHQRPVCITTVVTDVSCLTIPSNDIPRFRSINMDAITLDSPLAHECSSGLLADANGHVQGLWLSFLGERDNNGTDIEYHMGIHICTVLPVLRQLQDSGHVSLRSINAELEPVQMAQACALGLSDAWVRKVEEANPFKHQLFIVRRTEAGSTSAKVLRELDLILAVNGKVITRMYEMDVQYTTEQLDMIILRHKRELTVRVKTTPVSGSGTDRVVFWAGAMLQEPHNAVLQQSKTLPSRIYISSCACGSPASMYGLAHAMWITHINSLRLYTLDDLIKAVKHIADGRFVRVRCVTFDNVPIMLSVKMVNHYFPLVDMVKDDKAECGWSKQDIPL